MQFYYCVAFSLDIVKKLFLVFNGKRWVGICVAAEAHWFRVFDFSAQVNIYESSYVVW